MDDNAFTLDLASRPEPAVLIETHAANGDSIRAPTDFDDVAARGGASHANIAVQGAAAF